jgi:molybdenum ABC transporter molybdate-binding protein
MRFRRRSSRQARATTAWLAFLGSVALLAVFVMLLLPKQTAPDRNQPPLLVYCAAGLKKPVEAATRDFEAVLGQPVQLQFGGSQTLLANLEISRRGDLYIPADESYVDLAREKKLVVEAIPLATMRAVLAVRRGNPRQIRSLDDLLRSEVKLGQANPDAAATGKVARDALRQAGRWDALAGRTAVFKPTVNDVVNDLKLGAVDAGFVWDAFVRQHSDLEEIPVPALSNATSRVVVSVCESASNPAAALRFARFLAARDQGARHFADDGFQAIPGDRWAPHPDLHLLAGAMLRPAIEQTIQEFEKREGVEVTRVYNGCGILVAQMEAGERPDAYFACDKSFMAQVSDLFLDSADISQNQLVILVPKGNPRGIKELKDLGQPGLRLGVGHEKQCALGALTARMLITNNTYAIIRKNVAVESPTGDFLVNQLRTKSLDAVIAYISNATSAQDELEAIAIDIPCALAIQPVAIGREARYPQTTARLLERLRTAESRAQFESWGFTWKAGR